MKIKEILKDFWHLLWKDESWKGWVVSLIVLFIFIKFIFFPILTLITGSSLPIAIVESCSMHHKGIIFSDFNQWWESHEEKYSKLNITKESFENFSLKNGFTKGDIILITKKDPKKIKIGDIIIFKTITSNPVIHRVIGIKEENDKKIFSTYGDNNNGQLTFEKEIKEDQIIGNAKIVAIPYLGWIKLLLFEPFRNPSERGICSEN